MNKYKLLFFICIVCCHGLMAQKLYTLDECIEYALDNNVNVKNSKLDVRISEHTQKEFFTAYFPQLSAGGIGFSANNNLLEKDLDLSLVGSMIGNLGIDPGMLGIPPSLPVGVMKNGMIGYVSAIQPVFMGGQIINGNRLAKVGLDVAHLQSCLTDREVKLKTEQYYYQIISLKEKLKTVAEAEKQLNAIHKDVEKAVEAGIAIQNDLLRVELEKQKIASNRLKVENGIRVSKLMLKYYVGIEEQDFDVASLEEIIDENPLDYYISPQEGVMLRPENSLLDKSVEAASLKHKIAIGKNMPTIGVGAGWTYNDILDKDNDAGMIFAKVSIPISGWWGGCHSIKQARLHERKARNNREDSRNMMIVEIEAKWSSLTEAYEQVILASKSVESSSENLRLNREYYAAGTSTLTDLLNAHTMVQQSRDSYTEACNNYRTKKTEYLKVTGRE